MDFPSFPNLQTDEPGALVSFHFEDVEFDLPNEAALETWLLETAESEGKDLREVNYIFCSDDYLLDINRQYLQHDYYTDVITFPYSETAVQGDIFISADRVHDNARANGVPFPHELCRIMVHGLLHLAGHLDKTEAERRAMSEKENFYLEKFELLTHQLK